MFIVRSCRLDECGLKVVVVHVKTRLIRIAVVNAKRHEGFNDIFNQTLVNVLPIPLSLNQSQDCNSQFGLFLLHFSEKPVSPLHESQL